MLDVCTGTGDLALAYWRQGRGRFQVVGADFTHEMLARARQKAAKAAAAAGVDFIEADAQRLPFAEATFQIVSVAFGLRNVADTAQGLREMTRVCAPAAASWCRFLDAAKPPHRRDLPLVLPLRFAAGLDN